jgi:RNA polymerase sigma factor (sigma-70 family)
VVYARSKTRASIVAEDAVAEAWLRFFRQLKHATDDPSRALRKPESLRFWLYRTTLNALNDQFRSSGRQSDVAARVTSEARSMGEISYQPDELANIEGEERRLLLRAALARLGEQCRELLTLMAADPPLSYQEIAEILDRPIGSLGPTRKRCLERLRRELGVAV